MARLPRIEFAGAIYHVMARANNRDFIFCNKEDKILFLKTLSEACGKNGWRVYAYALMDNHYHLLLEVSEGGLVRGMTWLQSTFTMRFNKRNRRSGHVFSGRYKAILVERDSGNYVHELVHYIHLNPARAGIWPEMESDFFVAHSWTGLYWLSREATERPEWLDLKFILGREPADDNEANRAWHLRDLEERAGEEYKRRLLNAECPDMGQVDERKGEGWAYGSVEFKEKLKALFLERVPTAIKTRGKEIGLYYKIAAEDCFGLSEKDWPTMAKSDPRKIVVGLTLRARTSLGQKEIADLLFAGAARGCGDRLRKWEKLTSQSEWPEDLQDAHKKWQMYLEKMQ